MSELSDLYQEVLLDHNRSPRNFRALPGASRRAEGFNPLCGDRVTVFLDLAGGRVRDVAFQGSGCAISTAAASIMTEAVKGKSTEEIASLFARFHGLVTSEPQTSVPS
ncbi:MAG TPA: SUF system NifU family Fe-S cluster assembly protein, partial [Planctomycetota bacterium]|nr:SUF system NifU family Fe-S cluster assembly protein [Planctomycetota bacterium]